MRTLTITGWNVFLLFCIVFVLHLEKHVFIAQGSLPFTVLLKIIDPPASSSKVLELQPVAAHLAPVDYFTCSELLDIFTLY